MDAALDKASLDNAKTEGIVLSHQGHKDFMASSSPHRTQQLSDPAELYRGAVVTKATDSTSPSRLHVLAPDGLKSPVAI